MFYCLITPRFGANFPSRYYRWGSSSPLEVDDAALLPVKIHHWKSRTGCAELHHLGIARSKGFLERLDTGGQRGNLRRVVISRCNCGGRSCNFVRGRGLPGYMIDQHLGGMLPSHDLLEVEALHLGHLDATSFLVATELIRSRYVTGGAHCVGAALGATHLAELAARLNVLSRVDRGRHWYGTNKGGCRIWIQNAKSDSRAG